MLRDIAATRLIEVVWRQEDALTVIWKIRDIESFQTRIQSG
jgi:hypothetical protein